MANTPRPRAAVHLNAQAVLPWTRARRVIPTFRCGRRAEITISMFSTSARSRSPLR
ncbi:hypothetical protein KCP77_07960 [Salmonella enterica subsp. enterica]|nr:hypothetical protein KCP77_07960 [Salmonella enterica subsp. enterica]